MKLLFLIAFNILCISVFAVNNNQNHSLLNQQPHDKLTISLPTTKLSLKTTRLEIPYSYFIQDTYNLSNQAQVRVTFNLLGTNCFAFKPFYAKTNQNVNGSIPTAQCNIEKPGTYYGVATICLKKSIDPKTYELCKSEAQNIIVQ